MLLLLWETVAKLKVFPELMFPSLGSIWQALWTDLQNGKLFVSTGFSLYLILVGLGVGFALAILASSAAIISRIFNAFIDTVIAILHPLPGIALLPLAILWFGTGQLSIIFIIVHATLWPMILNILIGFKAIPKIYKEVGENIGLKGLQLVFSIMVPAAFPFVLSGLKIAWARAWRALIAAEMVFGSSGAQGGLGWYIFQQRFFLDIAGVFASLMVIIVIGLLVEDLLFGFVEKKTVKRWGMTA